MAPLGALRQGKENFRFKTNKISCQIGPMMCFLKKFQSGPCFKGEEGKKSEIYEFQCTRASSIKMIMTSSCSPSAKASKVNLNIQGISLMPFDLSGNLVIPRNCQYIPSAKLSLLHCLKIAQKVSFYNIL